MKNALRNLHKPHYHHQYSRDNETARKKPLLILISHF